MNTRNKTKTRKTKAPSRTVRTANILLGDIRLYAYDKTIYVFVLLIFGIAISYYVQGLLKFPHLFNFLMIFFGLVIIGWEQFKLSQVQDKAGERIGLRRAFIPFLKSSLAQKIILFANVGIIVALTVFRTMAGVPYLFLFDQFIIATWENLAFGMVAPFLVEKVVDFLWLKRTKKTPEQKRKTNMIILAVTIILCSIGFGFAHWAAYGGDIRIVVYLAGLGLIMLGTCYLLSPSTSITLHWLNNIFAVLYMTLAGVI